MHVCLGVILVLIVSQIPIWFWQKMSIPMLLISLLMLLVLLFVGVEVNGSRRWMSIAGLRLQPAEIAKLAMIIYSASYLTRKQGQIHQFTQGILNIGIVLAVLALLLLWQPDFGSFVVITAAVGFMMFLGGIRLLHTFLCLSGVAIVMTLMVGMSEYRMERVLSFRDPWADPFNSGFQLTQALIAIGRGEIFGVGLGGKYSKNCITFHTRIVISFSP